MKELGIMIRDMALDLKSIQMGIHTKVNFSMERLMGWVTISGIIQMSFMMVNSGKDIGMEKVGGRIHLEIAMMEIGN